MENLKNCINNDLANNYGNLCQRVFSFIKKNCNNKIPKQKNIKDIDKRLLNNLQNNLPNLVDLMNKQNLNEYIKNYCEVIPLMQTNILMTWNHGL